MGYIEDRMQDQEIYFNIGSVFRQGPAFESLQHPVDQPDYNNLQRKKSVKRPACSHFLTHHPSNSSNRSWDQRLPTGLVQPDRRRQRQLLVVVPRQ